MNAREAIVSGMVILLFCGGLALGGITTKNKMENAQSVAINEAVETALAECAATHNSTAAEAIEVISELIKRGIDIKDYDIMLNIKNNPREELPEPTD